MEKIETYVITLRKVERSCVPLNLTDFERVILSGLIDGKRQKEIAVGTKLIKWVNLYAQNQVCI